MSADHLMSCRTKNGYFSNTFFNQTVDIIDKPRLIDTQLLFLFVIGAGVISVAGRFAVPLRNCTCSHLCLDLLFLPVVSCRAICFVRSIDLSSRLWTCCVTQQ